MRERGLVLLVVVGRNGGGWEAFLPLLGWFGLVRSGLVWSGQHLYNKLHPLINWLNSDLDKG